MKKRDVPRPEAHNSAPPSSPSNKCPAPTTYKFMPDYIYIYNISNSTRFYAIVPAVSSDSIRYLLPLSLPSFPGVAGPQRSLSIRFETRRNCAAPNEFILIRSINRNFFSSSIEFVERFQGSFVEECVEKTSMVFKEKRK